MTSIKRPAHELKREKTLAMPRHMVFFDTETTMTKTESGDTLHRLRLGWACYYSPAGNKRTEKVEWFEFMKPEQFWAWLTDHIPNKNKLWVVAHQLSFDFTIVKGFSFLQTHGYKLKFFHSSGLTTIISIHKKGKSILFVDSLNWFAEPLAVIGERIGYPKGQVDFDNVSDSDLSVYCRRDVEILLRMFKQFVRFLYDNRISRLCYTLGSTAMSAFLFGSYKHKIYIHNNAEAIDLERLAYRGGRTECFYLGELSDGPYYVLDVNSLYPYVMCQCLYPVKYQKIKHKINPTELFDHVRTGAAIATVTLTTNEPVYGLRRDRLLFPVGRFTVTLCTPELLYAFEHNQIESVGDCVFYEQAPIFKAYVDRFYAMRNKFRESGDKLYEQFIKLLLNSLYGKFGQRVDIWKKIGIDLDAEPHEELCYDAKTRQRYKIRYLLGGVYESRKKAESFNSFPAIAAHVTANARMFFWEIMQQAGQGNYYYCDTDSLLVDTIGYERLKSRIDPTRLGFLKLEYTIDKVTIYGPKDYVFGDRVRIKGIKRQARQIGDRDFAQDQWPTLRGLLSRGETTEYVVKQVTKHLCRDYSKGFVQSDGRIRPYYFDEPSLFPQQ